MNDLYISKYVNLLKKIDESSEFEKILTDKFILLTCKNVLKLGNYKLPPLIDANLVHLVDLLTLIKNNEKKIVIINEFDTPPLIKQYKNVHFLNINNYKQENATLNNCDTVIILLDTIGVTNLVLTNPHLLKVILSKVKTLYCEYSVQKIKFIKMLFKYYKNAIFHSNNFYIKKFGFIQFSELKNIKGETFDVNGKTLQYKKICKSNDIFKYIVPSIVASGDKNKFIAFMYTMYEIKIKELNKKLREIEYIRKNYDKVMDNIDPYITTLINNGIEYCNKHNIKYNTFYDNFKLLNHKKFVNKYFKLLNNVNLNNVKISLDANYSITLPIAVEKIASVIRREMPSIQYIIDGNANIGSTGIYLSTFFKHVYSVEVVKSTFDILVHNIKEYNFEKKITPFHDSIIDFMKNCNESCHKFNIETYCLFLDPPWSGVFYKTEAVIDLFFGSEGNASNLDNINIIDFIKSLKSVMRYVCIKVPNNYNFSALYSAFYKITIHRLNGFYFVLLTI
jgi:predicted RNA methylase